MGNRRLTIVVLFATVTALALPLVAQQQQEDRTRRRLERVVIALDARLRQTSQLRARVLVTEYPDPRDPRAGMVYRRGTLARMRNVGILLGLSAAFPTITGTPPLEQVAFLGQDRFRRVLYEGEEVVPEAEGTTPSTARLADLLQALDQVGKPDLAERFEIGPGAGRIVVANGTAHRLHLVPLATNPLAERMAFLELTVVEPGWRVNEIEVVPHEGATISIGLSAIDDNPRLPQRHFDAAAMARAPRTAAVRPGRPTNLHAVPDTSRGSNVLYWNAPDGNEAVSGYVLEIGWFPGTAERARLELTGRETSFELPWMPGGPMHMRVLARNEAGESPPSSEVILDLPEAPRFDASVADPTYTAEGPLVLFDQAHHNFMDVDGTARDFLNLLRNDGYRIRAQHEAFDAAALRTADILVIANPYAHATEDWYHRGYEWWKWSRASAAAALDEGEVAAVVDFVRDGGSLLLMVGGAPWAGAASSLASGIGMEFRSADTRSQGQIPGTRWEPRFVHYVREGARQPVEPAGAASMGHLSATHPIVRGRGAETEHLWGVWSYLGQSIIGPPGSTSLLNLPDNAVDWLRPAPGAAWETRPAAGRSQAVAFELGEGRVVVVADAAVFLARAWRAGSIAAPMAMAWPEDSAGTIEPTYAPMPMNRQFALNVMHWLSGALR